MIALIARLAAWWRRPRPGCPRCDWTAGLAAYEAWRATAPARVFTDGAA